VHAGERYRVRRSRPQLVVGGILEPEEDTSARQLSELRAQLQRAVESENFELAAELRDRIRVLE
jgi:protein-arginine kinase activator protein McsA